VCELDLTGSGQGPVVGSFEHVKELPVFMTGG